MSGRSALAAGLGAILAVSAVPGDARADLAGEPSGTHAIVGARIVTAPGSDPFTGILVIRDGRFELVAREAGIPPGAVRHDLSGRTIYPGAIEAYRPVEVPVAEDEVPRPVPRRVRPETRVADTLEFLEEEGRAALRSAGFAVVQAVPTGANLDGWSAVLTLGDGPSSRRILDERAGQSFSLEHRPWNAQETPGSRMGAIALVRQTLLDAQWARDVRSAHGRRPTEVDRPEVVPAWDALVPVLSGDAPLIGRSRNVQELPMLTALAREFGARLVVVSAASDHYRREGHVAGWLRAAGASLVTSLAFPDAPAVVDPSLARDVELDVLRHWEQAPTDPARLERAGIPFAVTSAGLDSPDELLPALRVAISRGLSERAALAALTTEPARILGLQDRAGTIEPGKDAHLLVATGDLFAPGTTVESVWIDGRPYAPDPAPVTAEDLATTWEIVPSAAPDSVLGTLVVQRDGAGVQATWTAPADVEPAERGARLERGVLRLDAGDGPSAELRGDGRFLRGTWDEVPVLARRAPEPAPDVEPLLSIDAPAWPPETDPNAAPDIVLFRGATVWTQAGAGTLAEGDVLIRDGRIQAVGESLTAPPGAFVVDATGLHLTPGMLDAHSHHSVIGGVNECTQSCTAEVRIGDVIQDRSIGIYRDLGGGTTVSHQMHGSCNPIGGQGQIIKHRWGRPAAELRMRGAAPAMKFALGENVIRDGWDEPKARDRYPNTRMGVEQFVRDRFHAAEAYRRRWTEWRSGDLPTPPRRDLELDALVEILDGDRRVHCHAYRGDEMLAMIRTAEDFGFRVEAFHHALEAYQVADELAAHGAGVSAFADHWSNKLETIDGIPYNSPICHERGVLVSYNSDSPDVSRRMNLEAARAARWGGLPAEEALAFVTRNAAVQLGIEERVGTLEPGKDADVVLWSAPPLSASAVCLQTWVDGVKYFDREADRAARAAAFDLRDRLLEKAAAAAAGGAATTDSAGEAEEREMERGVCVESGCCGEDGR